MSATTAKRRRPRRRGHLRQRGSSWVVTFRVEGRQLWRSFKTREEAELYLADAQVKLARNEARLPVRVSFATAAEAWLEHGRDKGLASSTIRDRRSVLDHWLLPAFGKTKLEEFTAAAVTRWRREQMRTIEIRAGRPRPRMTGRTAEKVTSLLHGIFEFARREYGLASNPIARVERLQVRYDAARFDFYSPEEVWSLVRAANSEQDGAIYLTAAFAGLRRGECLALRWRDVDFEGEALRIQQSLSTVGGELKAPKSGRSRSVPMVSALAAAFDGLSRRGRFTGPDDFVFVGSSGEPLDGSAVRRRYASAQRRAGVRPLRFHDLRHSFGTVAANAALSGRELQEWMGHADYRTTSRYLHYRSRGDEAKRLASAFAVDAPNSIPAQAALGLATPMHDR
jgi:integrase